MENKLIQGDCLEVLPNLIKQGIKVDAIITDPPYYKIVDNDFDNQWKSEDDFIEWQKEWISEGIKLLSINGSFLMFGSIKNNALLKIKLWLDTQLIYRNWLTWKKRTRLQTGKNNFKNNREEILYYVKSDNFYFENQRGDYYKYPATLGNKYALFLKEQHPPYNKYNIIALNQAIRKIAKERNWLGIYSKKDECLLTTPYHWQGQMIGSVFEMGSDINQRENKNQHINQKPIKLFEMLIKSTVPENGLVLDLFMGSGGLAIACINTNRKYICIEKNKEYYEIGKKRIDYYTLQQKLF